MEFLAKAKYGFYFRAISRTTSLCSRILRQYVKNLLLLQATLRIFLSVQSTSTRYHFFNVIGLRTLGKMGRIYTWGIVTAVMQIFFGRSSSNEFPRNPMSTKSPDVVFVPNHSIMMRGIVSSNSGSHPNPAPTEIPIRRMNRTMFIHFVPESLAYWDNYELAPRICFHSAQG